MGLTHTQKFEDTIEANRSRKLQKDRQCNCQKIKNKRTNNNRQKTTQKTKNRTAQTTLKTGMNSGAPEVLAVLAPLVTPVVLLLSYTNIMAVVHSFMSMMNIIHGRLYNFIMQTDSRSEAYTENETRDQTTRGFTHKAGSEIIHDSRRHVL